MCVRVCAFVCVCVCVCVYVCVGIRSLWSIESQTCSEGCNPSRQARRAECSENPRALEVYGLSRVKHVVKDVIPPLLAFNFLIFFIVRIYNLMVGSSLYINNIHINIFYIAVSCYCMTPCVNIPIRVKCCP